MKTTTRFRILALEPDRTRGENLRRLIKERVDADVMIASSAQTAIASVARQVPDLVLTSALVSPADDEQLVSHLKALSDTRDLPILTVPPVVDAVGGQRVPTAGRRRLGFLAPRSAPPYPSYDADVVGERIAEALRSRARDRARPAVSNELEPLVSASGRAASRQPIDGKPALVFSRRDHRRRDRAVRWRPDDLPWLGGVQTPWGFKLNLLNISTSGLLVESSARFMPDSFSELYLFGSGTSIAVPARLVRSEVSEVSSLGVKYHTAAVFDRKLDLILEQHGLPRTSLEAPKVLADLLQRVTSDPLSGRQKEEARLLFERELRQLVPAREIQIREKPAASADGGESVYFTVPTGTPSPAVLQVTFEPDYEPAQEELSLLQAAASVAAVVLQYEGSSPVVGPVNAW